MKRVKNLVEGQKYIAQIIDGDLIILDLNGNKFHTDATKDPYWNGKKLAKVEDLVSLEGVENAEWDGTTGELTFTFHKNDKTPLVVRIPHLDIIDDIDYDKNKQEIVLKKKDNTELRVDVSDLIDIYTGTLGAEIEIEVENNEIKATLLPGKITEAHLTAALLGKINKIEQVADVIENHTHDGEGSPKISYNNIVDKLVDRFINNSVTTNWTANLASNLFDASYVVSKGSLRQSGTLKVRDSEIYEMDVFGNDEELNISFSVSGNNLTITNGGGGNVEVRLLVTYL